MNGSGKLSSSCRCKLSLALSRSCPGDYCQRILDGNMSAKSFGSEINTCTSVSPRRTSEVDTASHHSSGSGHSSPHSDCSSQLSTLKVSSTGSDDIELDIYRTPLRVPSSQSSSQSRSTSGLGYQSDANEQGSLDTPLPAKVVSKTEALSITKVESNSFKLLMIAMLYVFTLFIVVIILASVHWDSAKGNECTLLRVYKNINEISLRAIVEEPPAFQDPEKIIWPAYLSMWDQSERLLNSMGRATLEAIIQPALGVIAQIDTTFVFAGIALLVPVLTIFGIAAIFWPRKPEEYPEDVAGFVQKILRVLVDHQRHLPPSANPYLPVNYMKYLLIAPHDRKRMQKKWDAAVRTIGKNESRGRVVIKTSREGNKFWRFSPTARNSQTLGRSPLPVFNLVTPIGLTPCLQLQYMFDVKSAWGEDWAELMTRSVLETGNIELTESRLQEESASEGTVFFRCTSRQSAGRLHRFLQTWFYGQDYDITYIWNDLSGLPDYPKGFKKNLPH